MFGPYVGSHISGLFYTTRPSYNFPFCFGPLTQMLQSPVRMIYCSHFCPETTCSSATPSLQLRQTLTRSSESSEWVIENTGWRELEGDQLSRCFWSFFCLCPCPVYLMLTGQVTSSPWARRVFTTLSVLSQSLSVKYFTQLWLKI